MAEESEIVIFPKVRISELERDAERKKEALTQSKDELVYQIKQEARPVNLIKKHPKFVLGTLFTFLSGTKILSKAGGKVLSLKKSSLLVSFLKAGWLWKMFKFGAGFILKLVGPKLGKLAATKLANRFRSEKN